MATIMYLFPSLEKGNGPKRSTATLSHGRSLMDILPVCWVLLFSLVTLTCLDVAGRHQGPFLASRIVRRF